MKTITQIEEEIEMCIAGGLYEPIGRTRTVINNRVVWLRSVREYLETGPSVLFVERERARLTERLRLIDSQFDLWICETQFASLKQRREAYDRMHRVKELEDQLRTLQYILT